MSQRGPSMLLPVPEEPIERLVYIVQQRRLSNTVLAGDDQVFSSVVAKWNREIWKIPALPDIDLL